MERRKLKPAGKLPVRYLRECGHPNDWTLDVVGLDGTITSYCMGCVVTKLGLKPVERHMVKDGKLVEIGGKQ